MTAGYKGHLYLEISPRTFPILVRPGSRLAQIRFRRGTHTCTDAEMKRLHEELKLVDGEADIDGGIALTVDLAPAREGDIVGYRARRHSGVVDIDSIGAYDVLDFWDPLTARPGRNNLILDPDEFYILASREALHIPATHAAEMVPYDPLVGEFRVHYAGFFDPGFGAREAAGGSGSRAVLEVRSHEVPFILEHGQVIGRLVYEHMTGAPGAALRRRPRLKLPAPGAEAFKTFQGVLNAEASFDESFQVSYWQEPGPLARCRLSHLTS